jgi:ankyrin repeat protein
MEDILEAVRQGDEGQVAEMLDENPDLLDSMPIYQEWPLAEAAKHGQLGVVKLLAQRGANLNEAGRLSKTALHWAVEGGHEEVVAFLLSKNLRLNACDTFCKTPLMRACDCGHMGIFRMLVQHLGHQGMDATHAASLGLRYAARVGQESMVKYLLGEGAQVTKEGRRDWTALIEASARGHLGVVQMLVQHMGGQGLNHKDRDGRTALYHAVFRGHEEVVGYLLSKGAQATSSNEGDRTVLMEYSGKGHLSRVQLLLQNTGKEGLEERDMWGQTALYYAARGGHEEVVSILLGNGAQANSSGRDGMTPLMGASMHDHVGVVRMLVQHMEGQGLDERDRDGFTALYHAAVYGHESVVAILLSKRAQANISGRDGMTPLMGASMNNHPGVVRMLVQHMEGQGLEERDRSGNTALFHAARWGHNEIVNLLLSQGAQVTSRVLMLACSTDHLGVVQMLVQHMEEERLDERDRAGQTAVYHATMTGHEEIVAFLLSKGAQANSSRRGGVTPLMGACGTGSLGVVRLLVQHTGAQGLNARDTDRGWTALHWAASGGQEGVMRYLLLSGADPTIKDNEGKGPQLRRFNSLSRVSRERRASLEAVLEVRQKACVEHRNDAPFIRR